MFNQTRQTPLSPLRLLTLALCCLLTTSPLLAKERAADSELRNLLISAINDSKSFQDRFEAEVWLLDMSQRLQHRNRKQDQKHQMQLLKLIHAEAMRAELAPELVLAVIEVESNFDRWALSHAGAQGLMQVMPFWLKEIGKPGDNLFHVQTNLRLGCTILKYYLDKEDGDLTRGLARYNGSLGRNVYPNKVFNALRERWYRQ
ncbi:MAG: lytic transglycosylase domain-containing protein [Gammaproteobacteria bacterium]|nr:lytic transglycosylase domain-containing protein [Gammaproteobacteria bacterium]